MYIAHLILISEIYKPFFFVNFILNLHVVLIRFPHLYTGVKILTPYELVHRLLVDQSEPAFEQEERYKELC